MELPRGLGGKLTLATKFPKDDWRAMYFGPENLPNTVARVDKLKAIVPPGVSLPEMALRYILSNPTVSTTIVGMRKPEHVKGNIAASDAGVSRTFFGPSPLTLEVLVPRLGIPPMEALRATPVRAAAPPCVGRSWLSSAGASSRPVP